MVERRHRWQAERRRRWQAEIRRPHGLQAPIVGAFPLHHDNENAGAAAEMGDSQMDGPPEASEDDDDSTLEELEDVDDSMWDDIAF